MIDARAPLARENMITPTTITKEQNIRSGLFVPDISP